MQQIANSNGVCHLQYMMPIELWNEHLIPFLTLNEAVALAELSRYFYDVVHKSIQIQTEASLVCSVSELQRVLDKWRNLRNVAFQPVNEHPDKDRLQENIHYNVNASGGLNIIDLGRNEPAPEPVPTDEEYTDADEVGLLTRYACPMALQDLIHDGDDGPVQRLNLSGIARVRLFDGVNNLRELGLSGCSQIEGLHWLSGIHEVDLSYCSFLEDVSFLKGSQHVDLSYCHQVTDLTPLAHCNSVQLNVCRGISDVSPLRFVHRVSLRNCPDLSDVSMLNTVHELNIGGCVNVRDVSALGSGNVLELNLSGCVNVTDVSALGSIHTLKLRKCSGVVDVSRLGKVQDLDLTGCINVTDVTALGRVPKLQLALCRYVSDISALGEGVRELSLRQCDAVKDLSALGASSSLRDLDLSSCIGFESSELRHLPPLDRLVLSRCSQLMALDGLTCVRELDVSFCKKLQSLGSTLREVHTIVAYRCESLADITVLAQSAKHLAKVNLSGCSLISDVRYLAGAQNVDLRFCDSLEDVRPLAQSARVAKLAGCIKLVDVSPLTNAYELDLSYCPSVEDVSALATVHTLSLRHCPKLNLSDCCKLTDVSMLTGVRVLDLRYNKNNSDALKTGIAKLRARVPIIRQ
ncbi:hypothetical protein BBO99_00008816 [Phytophthora kernoviae]|uniref:Uncharacterized protein n=2 Tax=Phytophthora kernoviae TaxID=325452 RepID=A0A3R7J7L9_9STRA|nr:hypothetical protein G195_010367 [Phytophthora kernoviae 00238/432]KAG2509783.1 hypothetical protein JM16_008657 [Phytophthora kernoviae]KAG2511080.1 hypothetical protein JM18_008691 [Phytophthora kernoviae]RLN36614.1 hypothetical protein BBI17_008835 [Phytophthora kernoviae]RLN74659.1 hypothetical protein BBO99_00008816 [Phytophthora kernoviae]